jgi:cytochrome P450
MPTPEGQTEEQDGGGTMADSFRTQGFWDDELYPALKTDNPQPEYVKFSGKCPVAHNPDGTVTVLRYDDIKLIHQSPDVLGNGHSGPGIVGAKKQLIPIDLDGPEHRRWRELLNPLFTPRMMKPLEPKIRARAVDLLDSFADAGEADVFHAWCEPLPTSIFLSIMGLPQSDLQYFLDFMNSQLHPDPSKTKEENLHRQKEGAQRCYSYVDSLIEDRAKSSEPHDDLVNWLLTLEDEEGRRLPREDVHAVMYLFLLAGLDTVASTLGNCLSLLARNPDKRQEVLDNPALWPDAVEELLRYDPAIPFIARKALVDLDLPSGEQIEAGTVINVSLPGANMDPSVFPNPLEIDFTRRPNAHITFASGWHRCVGSHLARLEIRAALEEFHKRIPHYSIKPGAELVYSHDPRAPRHLPLVWET